MDRLINRTMIEVDIGDVKLDVRRRDDGMHGEGHRSRLVGDANRHRRFQHASLWVEELSSLFEQRLPENLKR